MTLGALDLSQAGDINFAHANKHRYARTIYTRHSHCRPLNSSLGEWRPVRQPWRHQIRAAKQLAHHKCGRMQQGNQPRHMPQGVNRRVYPSIRAGTLFDAEPQDSLLPIELWMRPDIYCPMNFT